MNSSVSKQLAVRCQSSQSLIVLMKSQLHCLILLESAVQAPDANLCYVGSNMKNCCQPNGAIEVLNMFHTCQFSYKNPNALLQNSPLFIQNSLLFVQYSSLFKQNSPLFIQNSSLFQTQSYFPWIFPSLIYYRLFYFPFFIRNSPLFRTQSLSYFPWIFPFSHLLSAISNYSVTSSTKCQGQMVAYGWKPLSRARLDHNGYFFSFLEYDNCQCRCNALFISSQFREKNSVFAIEKFQFFVHQEYHNVTTPNSEIPIL